MQCLVHVQVKENRYNIDMKKVINTADASTILKQDVLRKPRPILGFVVDTYHRGFLVHAAYDSNLYFARKVSGFEQGNGYTVYNNGQEKGMEVEGWMTYLDKAEWFLFDTPKELFKWLSE